MVELGNIYFYDGYTYRSKCCFWSNETFIYLRQGWRPVNSRRSFICGESGDPQIASSKESFYDSPPNTSLTKSPVLKPAPGRNS